MVDALYDDIEVIGAVIEKLRKACVLDLKCSKRGHVLARTSTRAQTKV